MFPHNELRSVRIIEDYNACSKDQLNYLDKSILFLEWVSVMETVIAEQDKSDEGESESENESKDGYELEERRMMFT